MESPVTGRPNRETGLPPGVEVGPLGRRFVAFLINMSVPVVVSLALIFLLPTTSGALRMTLAIIGAIIAIGWLIVVWYLLAVRAASPGLRAMKLQVVGFLDGRPIGLSRAFIRGLVFWALYITGIGLLLMLIFELRQPRKQGWHDLAATAVMIKERILAPAAQPARAAAPAMQSPQAAFERFPAAEWCSPGSVRRPDVPELCRRGGLRLSRQPSAAWPTDSTARDGRVPDGSSLSVRRGCRHAAEWTERPVRRQCVRDAAPRRAVRTAAAIRATTAIRAATAI